MFARRVAIATVVQAVGKAVALACALLSVKLLTGYLGTEGYGGYAIVLSGAGLAFAISDLGIPMLLARELAKDPSRGDDLGAVLLFLRLLSCGAILLLVAVATPFLPYTGEVKQGLVLGTAGLLVGVVALYPTPFFQVHLRLDLAALTEVVTRLVALLTLVVVVVADLGFLAAVATILVSWAVGAALAFRLSRRFWRPSVRVDFGEARSLLGSALPIALIGVLGILHFRIDALLLSFLRPARDVGIYALAYSVFEQALVLQALFMAAVFPILTRLLHERDAAAARDVVDKSVRFLVSIGVVAACLLCTLAEPIVHVLASEDFGSSVRVLRLLAFGLLPLYATAVFGSLLISVGTLRAVAVVSAVAIVVNVALNLAFIPRWTYDAAAVATIVTETLGLVLVYAVAYRAREEARLPVSTVVRLALLVAAGVGLALLVLVWPWWVAAPAALVGSVTVAFALRVVAPVEVRAILRP